MRSYVPVLAFLCAPVLSHASCWDEAGQQYGIEPPLLKAIEINPLQKSKVNRT